MNEVGHKTNILGLKLKHESNVCDVKRSSWL